MPESIGIEELSHLKENIISYDSLHVSWRFFNAVHFSNLKVYSIDSNISNIVFCAVKDSKNQIYFFQDDTFYIYTLVRKTQIDSVNILLE
ncbi:hypothetical protein [Saccharicrinis sp. FJH62]|uniref:hypothetical protein n=1 Tax=Saccharicrinis sp. FJH62 TaxID=3344657 RepID=UPI0035D51591